MSELRAGWAKREITPEPGYAMAGYIARQGNSVGVLDPLYVRVLLLEQGKTRVVIILADVLLISSRCATHLRKVLAGALTIRPESVVVAATHTHSGPILDMHPFNFSGGRSEPCKRQYSKKLETAMLQASLEASILLRRVTGSFAKIEVTGVATDRNRPRRAHRQNLFIFKFSAPKEVALLATYGCHPTVLGADNRRFSGDLHGAISRILEKKAAIALVANGAAANISTRFMRRDQTPREVTRLATQIGRQLVTARFEPLTIAPITARARTVVLPLADLKMTVPVRRSRSTRKAIVDKEGLQVRARLSHMSEFSKVALKLQVTVWRLGTIALTALPLEIYSDTGEFLWRRAHVIPICYANGYWGYLPSSAAAPDDYEVLSSPFSRTADAILRRSILF